MCTVYLHEKNLLGLVFQKESRAIINHYSVTVNYAFLQKLSRFLYKSCSGYPSIACCKENFISLFEDEMIASVFEQTEAGIKIRTNASPSEINQLLKYLLDDIASDWKEILVDDTVSFLDQELNYQTLCEMTEVGDWRELCKLDKIYYTHYEKHV